jgi:hypothetical protein
MSARSSLRPPAGPVLGLRDRGVPGGRAGVRGDAAGPAPGLGLGRRPDPGRPAQLLNELAARGDDLLLLLDDYHLISSSTWGSPTPRPPACSGTPWDWTSRHRRCSGCGSGPRAGRPGWSWPACRCGAAPTWSRSSPPSGPATATSSTTSAARCWPASPSRCAPSWSGPRSCSACRRRCATPCWRPRTPASCWPSWSRPTCS